MSNLTPEQRAALPNGDFAWFAPNGERMFPIVDEADVKAALWRLNTIDDPMMAATILVRAQEIAARKGLRLPPNFQQNGANFMVNFNQRHDTSQGQRFLQRCHDLCAESGAICSAPAQMHSTHELQGIQAIHDEAVKRGARCADSAGASPYFSAEFNARRPDAAQVVAGSSAQAARFCAQFNAGVPATVTRPGSVVEPSAPATFSGAQPPDRAAMAARSHQQAASFIDRENRRQGSGKK